MKITHPAKGYSGYVQVGTFGIRFLAGTAHALAKDIDGPVRDTLEASGFDVTDDRPGRNGNPRSGGPDSLNVATE